MNRFQDGILTISKIVYPLAVVLSQECDLEQDYKSRHPDEGKSPNNDKNLLSIIMAPMYNYDHFILGEHLIELDMEMQKFPLKKGNTESTDMRNLKNNETPRYHYFDFGNEIDLPKSVVDFKHYFTINLQELEKTMQSKYVCALAPLFRERLVQRFSNYLSRIGLP